MTALKGLQMTGRISYCQRPPNINSLWRVDRLNLHGKSTVKNKYLKIMQTRATPALELPCIWTIYKLKNTDSLFCSFYVFFLPFFPPLKCICPFAISLSTFSHSDKDLYHILQTWPGQLKLC